MRNSTFQAATLSLFEEYAPTAFRDPVRSPLNYIGGKYKLLPQILHYLPDEVRYFVDLFCGGCNVGVNVKAEKVYFNDNLTYLIDLYKTLKQNSLEATLDQIRNRIKELNLSLTNTEAYLRLRSQYNTAKNPLDLFVLIAYSFNHQIRFNSAHHYNNPFGKNRSSFNHTMESNLIRFIERLHDLDCEFSALDFKEVDINRFGSKDFVYCDPPYLITTGTYNDGKRGFTGWSEQEEISLLSLLDRLNANGVRFALSNVLSHKGKTNTILTDWSKANGYNVAHLTMNYANSNYHTSDRSKDSSDEILIYNYQI